MDDSVRAVLKGLLVAGMHTVASPCECGRDAHILLIRRTLKALSCECGRDALCRHLVVCPFGLQTMIKEKKQIHHSGALLPVCSCMAITYIIITSNITLGPCYLYGYSPVALMAHLMDVASVSA